MNEDERVSVGTFNQYLAKVRRHLQRQSGYSDMPVGVRVRAIQNNRATIRCAWMIGVQPQLIAKDLWQPLFQDHGGDRLGGSPGL